jgi:succinyl-diaminopimelate desuccinylase
MKRNTLWIALLAAAAGAAAQQAGRGAEGIEPALPVVGPMPELPEAYRRNGAREANGRRAFLEYVRRFAETSPDGPRSSGLRRLIEGYLRRPAAFGLRADEASEGFLGLAGRFAERRMFEPIIATAASLVRVPTWRRSAEADDAEFEAGLSDLAAVLRSAVEELNAAQPEAEPLVFVDWRGPAKDGCEARIVGARVGRGPRRLAVITHVDTVAPIRDDWGPFRPRLEVVPFRGTQHLFLRGRGAIDDKGPTAAALHALDVLRSVYSGTPLFERCSFELLADTAEETRRRIPDYLAAVGAPEAGNVLDAAWSLYAEKGSERPVFRVPAGSGAAGTRLRLLSLATPAGPRNQIPERATALFAPGVAGAEAGFRELTEALALYRAADSERARFELGREAGAIAVVGVGSGAAHGSAPHVNKAQGHNPLACLAGFVEFLWRRGSLEPADPLALPLFLAWAFGHNVHGEDHPELLQSRDEVFTDGTTYALTRLTEDASGFQAQVDIRYALGHHGLPWDGKSFGTLPGDSRFRGILTRLLDRFNAGLPAELSPVAFETRTGVGPDLKDRGHPRFRSLLAAYEAVVGRPSPLLAIGGGTDAKGYPMLFACGPNFSRDLPELFNPPVNYHGVDEGAPVEDLTRSAEILVRWLAVSGFEEP